MIELVDFNEIYGKGIDTKKEGSTGTRRAGGSRKKTETSEVPTKAEAQTQAEPDVEVAPAEETPEQKS